MKQFRVLKYILGIVTALFLLVLPWTPTVAMSDPIAILLDGQMVTLDQPAVMSQGRVMVPLRGIFERLGAQVNYNAAQRNITASRGTTLVSLFLNSSQAQVNGVSRTMDSPPMVIGSRILVPLRFVSEALGADVKWQANNNTVNILSQTGGVDLTYPPNQQPYAVNQQQYEQNQEYAQNPLLPIPIDRQTAEARNLLRVVSRSLLLDAIRNSPSASRLEKSGKI